MTAESNFAIKSDASAHPETSTPDGADGARAELWQCRSRLRFHQRHVDGIDKSIGVHVFAEVGIRKCVARLRFRLTHIDRVSELIGVGIADEESGSEGR